MKLRIPTAMTWLTALAAGSLVGCQSGLPLPHSRGLSTREPAHEHSTAARIETPPLDQTLANRNTQAAAQTQIPVQIQIQPAHPEHQTQPVSVREPRRGVEGEGADGVARVAAGKPEPHRARPSGEAMALASYRTGPSALSSGITGSISGPLTSRPVQGPRTSHLRAISFSRAEPRQATDGNGQRLQEPASSWMTGTGPQRYPDEYLFDGGDRGLPVHDLAFGRGGLDTEDTIAEYRDHTGTTHRRATDSVAIYAPRFGSVRSVTTPGGEFNIERLAGIQDRSHNSGVQTKIGPQRYARTDRLKGIRVRSRASGVDTHDWHSGLASAVRASAHEKLINAFMDFSFTLQGEVSQADEARLQVAIDAASRWTRNENPVVLAKLDSLHQVEARFKAAEMVGVEDEAPEPGELRIVKLADRSSAQPGDVVTFVIRYDNVGDRELHDVTIVDNLTPRLEFLEDSATSDLPGEVTMEDNGEGSLILTFRLDNPLPGRKEKDAAKNRGRDIRTGGVITFQCRVR